MIEQWLEELGVTIQYSIHDHFGWMRGYEGRANTPERDQPTEAYYSTI